MTHSMSQRLLKLQQQFNGFSITMKSNFTSIDCLQLNEKTKPQMYSALSSGNDIVQVEHCVKQFMCIRLDFGAANCILMEILKDNNHALATVSQAFKLCYFCAQNGYFVCTMTCQTCSFVISCMVPFHIKFSKFTKTLFKQSHCLVFHIWHTYLKCILALLKLSSNQCSISLYAFFIFHFFALICLTSIFYQRKRRHALKKIFQPDEDFLIFISPLLASLHRFHILVIQSWCLDSKFRVRIRVNN